MEFTRYIKVLTWCIPEKEQAKVKAIVDKVETAVNFSAAQTPSKRSRAASAASTPQSAAKAAKKDTGKEQAMTWLTPRSKSSNSF